MNAADSPALPAAQQQRAKRYEAIQNWLFVVDLVASLAALIVFLAAGWSAALAAWSASVAPRPWLDVTLYAVAIVIGAKLVFLPLAWFGDFHLEHRYRLSNETFGAWAWDQTKSLLLNLALAVVALNAIYFLLRHAGDWWWIGAGLFFLVFGVALSTLYPVLILPLFYKLEPLNNESLQQKLVALADRVGARVLGVYRMGLSDKTKKANAAFAGLGKTKRILLGDTLLDHFAEDEIEIVIAHEMAHYKHGDIGKLLAWSSVTTFVGFWICDVGFRLGLERLGFADRADVGAFPLLALCLMLFGVVVMPLNNAFSRWREWKADQAALALTGNRDGFIRAMRKLADQNLADLAPHPAVEFLLHDHPSLARRIHWAEQWRAG